MLNRYFRLFFIISLLLLFGFSFNTQSESGDTPNGITPNQISESITYAMPYLLDQYSYYTADSYASSLWLSTTSASLIKKSTTDPSSWTKDLVASMPIRSADNLTYTFTLRNDLFFSSGNELNATDVAFSLKFALTAPINPASYYYLSSAFSNTSIVILDSYTFTITFIRPTNFAYTYFDFPIVDTDVFLQRYDNCLIGIAADCLWNDPSGNDVVGAGPFMVSNITGNTQVSLVPNPYYYAANQTWADEIIFKYVPSTLDAINGITNGTLQILDSNYVFPIDQFSGNANVISDLSPTTSSQEISLNHLHPYFGTGESIPGNIGPDYNDALFVRKAMSHIVDRQFASDVISGGLAVPSSSIVSPYYPGFDSTIFPRNFSLSTARNYMAMAGFDYSTLGPENPDGTFSNAFFNITVLSPNTNPLRNQWSANYVLELQKIGIGVTQHLSTGWVGIIPRTFGWASATTVPLFNDGGYDILFLGYGWVSSFNPYGLYDSIGSCINGDCSNFYNFDLNENQTNVASIVRSYVQENDETVRISKLKNVQKVLHDNIPAIPILNSQAHTAYSSDVENLDIHLLMALEFDWYQLKRTNFTLNTGGVTPTSTATITMTTTISSTSSTIAYYLSLSSPSNITFTQGTLGNQITWDVDGSNPYTYEIYQNGSLIESNTWLVLDKISISLDELSTGTYEFEFILYDKIGYNLTDQVNVIVKDPPLPLSFPSLSSPPDITFIEGSKGNQITWDLNGTNPDKYEIYRDDTLIESDIWLPETSLSISLNGLSAGTYEYLIYIYDVSGNVKSDRVKVTVLAEEESSDLGESSQSTDTKSDPVVQLPHSVSSIYMAMALSLLIVRLKRKD